jgi:hypothetical protein
MKEKTMARKRKRFAGAKHSRKKVLRLLNPRPLTAPWLTTVRRSTRGIASRAGAMHFVIYRSPGLAQVDRSSGTAPSKSKLFTAKVCIGKRGHEKYVEPGPRFRTKSGCDFGAANTPGKALAAALKALGRRIATR